MRHANAVTEVEFIYAVAQVDHFANYFMAEYGAGRCAVGCQFEQIGAAEANYPQTQEHFTTVDHWSRARFKHRLFVAQATHDHV